MGKYFSGCDTDSFYESMHFIQTDIGSYFSVSQLIDALNARGRKSVNVTDWGFSGSDVLFPFDPGRFSLRDLILIGRVFPFVSEAADVFRNMRFDRDFYEKRSRVYRQRLVREGFYDILD